MYRETKKELKVDIEISSTNPDSDKSERFYQADFVKCDVTLDEGVLFFSKYLLKEFYFLTKSDVKKEIWYVINYFDNVVYNSFKDSNDWLDQLSSLLELDDTRIMYKQLKEKDVGRHN